jgi:cytochrome c
MDSFELNKTVGAVLGTCLGVLVLNIAASAIFAPEKPTKPGYEIAVRKASWAEKRN